MTTRRIIILALFLVVILSGTALAAEAVVNPGVRIGNWIQTNVAALFAPLLAVVALYYLVRREFTRFLSFAVFAVLAALFIFAGDSFSDAAVGLGRWIIGR
ncbi:MAG TPA: hypothetical protein VD902_14820 [Symbiobacteriaceae bacterium]|nr:hypothetical protein [Symbiobacteriaceae bacterium]